MEIAFFKKKKITSVLGLAHKKRVSEANEFFYK